MCVSAGTLSGFEIVIQLFLRSKVGRFISQYGLKSLRLLSADSQDDEAQNPTDYLPAVLEAADVQVEPYWPGGANLATWQSW